MSGAFICHVQLLWSVPLAHTHIVMQILAPFFFFLFLINETFKEEKKRNLTKVFFFFFSFVDVVVNLSCNIVVILEYKKWKILISKENE
jgi:hypothetical protein